MFYVLINGKEYFPFVLPYIVVKQKEYDTAVMRDLTQVA